MIDLNVRSNKTAIDSGEAIFGYTKSKNLGVVFGQIRQHKWLPVTYLEYDTKSTYKLYKKDLVENIVVIEYQPPDHYNRQKNRMPWQIFSQACISIANSSDKMSARSNQTSLDYLIKLAFEGEDSGTDSWTSLKDGLQESQNYIQEVGLNSRSRSSLFKGISIVALNIALLELADTNDIEEN